MKILPVILAGGSGTRLWPLSREHYPKQLLPLHGVESLLQQTVVRLDGLAATASAGNVLEVLPPLVVCNEEQRFLIAEQLRSLGREPTSILLEPVARNTAPALTVAALAALAGGDDPVLVVMPADHVIRNTEALNAALRRGVDLAGQDMIGTFGIVPDRAETGYGYIRMGAVLAGASGQPDAGAYELAAFVEKPDQAKAQTYLDSGDYLWNSGMFIVRASVWLGAVRQFQGEMAVACEQAYTGARADGGFLHLASAAFEACPSDSIDYAVMERLVDGSGNGTRAGVIPLDAGWSDVGAWSALLEIREADADGNVKGGDVFALNTRDSLLLSESRLLATVGVDNLVIVETPDAVLIADRASAQDVKKVVQWLKAEGRTEGQTHRKVYRPWGAYECLEVGGRYQVKRLTVNPGQAISLQMHHHRAEHWVVVRGTARVTRDQEVFLLSENQSTYIPIGATHRLENPGKVPLEIVEVQSGSYLGEDDIVRFEDYYNREAEG